MKRIILFEDLNKLNFYFSLLLIPFFRKIYFREASYAKNHFFFKKKFNKFFLQVGLKDLNGHLVNKSFNLKKYLIKKYLNNNFNPQIFDNLCELNNIKKEDKKKLIYSIENIIYLSKYEAIDTSSYICIKDFFSNCISYYVPSSENSYRVMSQIKNDKLKIINLTLMLSSIFSILKKTSSIFFNRINSIIIKSNKDKIKHSLNYNNTCTVGYFPHRGLKYDNIFKKIFFYQRSVTSPLFKDNIETLSFDKFDKLTQRYFRINKLRNVEMGTIPNIVNFQLIRKFFFFFFKNSKYIYKHKFLNFRMLLQIFLSIQKYNNFFLNRKYKYLFFYNDTHISSGLLLSASINQIKTISFQDRLTSYNYYHRCFFDLYLIAGKKFKQILKKKYFINDYKVLGLTRSNLIYKKKSPLIENILNKNFKIITCLLTAPNTDWATNIHGEDGTSLKSILSFCKEIVALSRNFKNHYFVIKFKILNPLNDVDVITFINEIILSSNNVILHANKDILSTNFVAHSDLVIGKYSTILDEALIKGKDILIHDDENAISKISFFQKNKILIINNYDELLLKTKNILEKREPFYKSYVEGKFYYINNYITDEGNVGSQKKIVDIVENYIDMSND